ncbi:MAG: disulfide oxidoreductase, partial [Rhodospirillales bacterium]|nr:disulfide oxidoreductase [Rhodospirillales bacterium]
RSREADDQVALATLARDPELRKAANHPDRVRLLWEICQIPDFRKVMAEAHTRLLAQVWKHLTTTGRLPDEWLEAQVKRLDRTEGDIDTIIQRIANIRTWTYVSHRGEWVGDPFLWQERTRAIEDKLSDALHERLTQRFVDKRTSVLARRLKDQDELLSAVARSGEVLVEGHHVGTLAGFRFVPAAAENANAARAVAAAAQRALRGEIGARVGRLAADGDNAFAVAEDGLITWHGAMVARLSPGPDALRPVVEPLASDLLEPMARDIVRRRLTAWLEQQVATYLKPLFVARQAALSGPARGLVYQLTQALGSMPRPPAEAQLRALDEAGRQAVARLGIRLGVESLYFPTLLKPAAAE